MYIDMGEQASTDEALHEECDVPYAKARSQMHARSMDRQLCVLADN